jgi:hypothetical protein
VGYPQAPRLRNINQQFGIPAGRALADPLPDEPVPEVPTVPEPDEPVLEPLPMFDAEELDPDLDRT